MSGFNYKADLDHQKEAVQSILNVISQASVESHPEASMAMVSNPYLKFDNDLTFARAIKETQEFNGLRKDSPILNKTSRVLDISMETGTGKTYTYTKTMFELNEAFGINKFIVVVPTLSIKAGTVNFLRSKAARQHFLRNYDDRYIKTYVVESQKSSKKSKRTYLPQSITQFVEARSHPNPELDKAIHVLVVNAGMLNSPTLSHRFDSRINDLYDTLMDAMASVNPVTIVDEPHKFKTTGKYWRKVLELRSQYILRFGATFDDQYENLIHELSAVDAFNKDLVKGVVAEVEEFEGGEDISIKLLRLFRDERKNGSKSKKINEPTFELRQGSTTKKYKLVKGESLEIIHEALHGLTIEHHNSSVVILSNGLELKRGDIINPYSYSETLRDRMITKAVKRHFEIEKELMSRDVRIKPLTLFFIDDIATYRGQGHDIEGSLKISFERALKFEIEQLIDEGGLTPSYKDYLEQSLIDLSLCHGGYFARDNSESDDAIEKEVTEILHDKESLLSLDNRRRFIFSKWTLREGWDNPNVFQICKLRQSGSHTSKLQEVGRGLRLPVNEYMSRESDENFYLHYYVDFTEKNFAEELVDEINKKSGYRGNESPTSLSEALLQQIMAKYPDQTAQDIRNKLGSENAIDFNHNFKEGGLDKLNNTYPGALTHTHGLKGDKIKVKGTPKSTSRVRVAKYQELKKLWEAINQRVILEYKVASESEFEELFKSYLYENQNSFKQQGAVSKIMRLEFEKGLATLTEKDNLENQILPIPTMTYSAFLKSLAVSLGVNIITLHKSFEAVQNKIDINNYLSTQTIRTIKAQFNKYLLDNAFSKFSIGYQRVSNQVHPTAFTDHNGYPLNEVPTHGLGTTESKSKPSEQYFLEDVFYDSKLERDNITTNIKDVTVFTKIPKNSIQIPVSGGGTYSPDFAYVIEYKNGNKELNLILETKGKDKRELYHEESQKIKHAQLLFESSEKDYSINFDTQFKDEAIKEILQRVVELNN